MKTILVASLALALVAGAASASPLSCEVRLRNVGVSPTGLQIDQVIELDGQKITVVKGDTADSICRKVDTLNDPIKQRDSQIKALTDRITKSDQQMERLKYETGVTNWWKKQWWLGWALATGELVFVFGLIIGILVSPRRRAYR